MGAGFFSFVRGVNRMPSKTKPPPEPKSKPLLDRRALLKKPVAVQRISNRGEMQTVTLRASERSWNTYLAWGDSKEHPVAVLVRSEVRTLLQQHALQTSTARYTLAVP